MSLIPRFKLSSAAAEFSSKNDLQIGMPFSEISELVFLHGSIPILDSHSELLKLRKQSSIISTNIKHKTIGLERIF